MRDAVLVGFGNRAQTHAAALAGSDRYDLVAVCGLEREKAERTADGFAGLLDAAVEHAPRADWLLRIDGTAGWDRERIGAAVARGLRFIEARRPRR